MPWLTTQKETTTLCNKSGWGVDSPWPQVTESVASGSPAGLADPVLDVLSATKNHRRKDLPVLELTLPLLFIYFIDFRGKETRVGGQSAPISWFTP